MYIDGFRTSLFINYKSTVIVPEMVIVMCRASMIWIIGEYAERIDNADELLENFLDGFHDENTQVICELLFVR